jgi:hypothetical protein
MARDIFRRLTALERHRVGTPKVEVKVEVWINEGDGIVRHRSGRVMTKEAFDAAFPHARHISLNLFRQ